MKTIFKLLLSLTFIFIGVAIFEDKRILSLFCFSMGIYAFFYDKVQSTLFGHKNKSSTSNSGEESERNKYLLYLLILFSIFITFFAFTKGIILGFIALFACFCVVVFVFFLKNPGLAKALSEETKDSICINCGHNVYSTFFENPCAKLGKKCVTKKKLGL